MTRSQHLLIGGGLLMLSLWAWSGVRLAGFVAEDVLWQTAWERDPSWRAILSSRPWALLAWRALPDASVAHVVNLAGHLLVAGLVGVLAAHLGLSSLGAWIATAVMALHPLGSETVAYLSARTELLALLGLLGVLLASLRPLTVQTAIVVGLCAALALGSKETAVSGLVLVPLLRGRWVVAAGLFVALLGAVLLGGPAWTPDPQMNGWFTPLGRLAWGVTQLAGGGRLCALLFWPVGLTVDFDYAHWAPLAALASGLFLIDVAVIAVVLRGRAPLIAAGLAWMVAVILLRTVIVTPGSFLNEHQVYQGLPGFALAVGALIGGRA